MVFLNTVFSLVLLITIVQIHASPIPKAEADAFHGSSYGPPRVRSHRPRYKKPQQNVHHHYYHRGAPEPTFYSAPKPSYHAPKPSYNPPTYADYGPPARRPIRYAQQPNYDYDYDVYEPRPKNPIHTSGEDPWLHIHKEEATRSALLFGVGVLKGVVVTSLINNANNNGGITIGK